MGYIPDQDPSQSVEDALKPRRVLDDHLGEAPEKEDWGGVREDEVHPPPS